MSPPGSPHTSVRVTALVARSTRTTARGASRSPCPGTSRYTDPCPRRHRGTRPLPRRAPHPTHRSGRAVSDTARQRRRRAQATRRPTAPGAGSCRPPRRCRQRQPRAGRSMAPEARGERQWQASTGRGRGARTPPAVRRGWPGRRPAKSFVTRWPSGSVTKLLYGRWRGSSALATTEVSAARRWAWLPNTTCSEPSAWAASPPGHIGPPARSGDWRTTSSVMGSICSTQHGASSPEAVPQHVHLAWAAQHHHRRSGRVAVRHREALASRQAEAGMLRGRHLQPKRTAVLGGPRAGPERGRHTGASSGRRGVRAGRRCACRSSTRSSRIERAAGSSQRFTCWSGSSARS